MPEVDKDLRVKITTEADNAGAQSVTESLDDVGAAAEQAGKKTTKSARETDAAYDTVVDTLQTVADQATKSGQVAEDALGETQKAAENLKDALDDDADAARKIGQATQQSSQQQVGAIQSIKQSVSILRSGWLKVAAAVTSVQGAIGIVTAAIGWAKTAWEWWNRDAIAAEKRKQEELQKTAEKIAALNDVRKSTQIDQQNANIRLINEREEQRALNAIKDRTDAIREQSLALIDQYEITAKLQGIEIDRDRIKLERRRAKGEIAESDYAQQSADLDLQKNRTDRDKQYKQAEAAWDIQRADADKLASVYDLTLKKLEKVKNDPRYISDEDVAKNQIQYMNSSREYDRLSEKIKAQKESIAALEKVPTGFTSIPGLSGPLGGITVSKDEKNKLLKTENEKLVRLQSDLDYESTRKSDTYGRLRGFGRLLEENGHAGIDKDGNFLGQNEFRKEVKQWADQLGELSPKIEESIKNLQTSSKDIENLRTVQQAEDRRDVEQGQAQVADAKDSEAAAKMDKEAEGVQQALKDTADVITIANDAIKSAAENLASMTPWTAQNRDAARRSMDLVQQAGIDPSVKNVKNLQAHLDRWREHEKADPSPDGKEVMRMLQAAINKAGAEQAAKSGTDKYNAIRTQQHDAASRRADYQGGAAPDQAMYQPTATDWATPDQYRQMPLPRHLSNQRSRLPGRALKRPGAGGVYADPEQAYQQAREVLGQTQALSEKQGSGADANISSTLQQTSNLLQGLKESGNTQAYTQLAQEIVKQLGPIVDSGKSQKREIEAIKRQLEPIARSVQDLLTKR